MTVRTRFAPSPTGYLHIGGARTALFSWAYARRYGGTFILRIEDTDVARSTPEAVQAILDGMNWLGLNWDEGAFYQMQRMPRYMEVIGKLLEMGKAYHCYCSREELDEMRERQMAVGLKPRYDGRWRPMPGKTLPQPPAGVQPVVRFKNPQDGVVVWDDLVKGRIAVANDELDDFIIARDDGTPTYNFCVVVDDSDMRITHVIRGDDHVNNTPRQINLLHALGTEIPLYAHLSMILGDDGQKLSKRHGAVSVMQYDEDGYLPEAVLNYLARLGWSHGDEEVFSMEQFCQWFDLDHITPSAAQFNTEKLNWLNEHYLKLADSTRLAGEVSKRLVARSIATESGPALPNVLDFYKERATTLNELTDAVEYYYKQIHPAEELLQKHLTTEIRPILSAMRGQLGNLEWSTEAIHAVIEHAVMSNGLKFPKVAMPLRVMLTGGTQSPSIDTVMTLLGKAETLHRIDEYLESV